MPCPRANCAALTGLLLVLTLGVAQGCAAVALRAGIQGELTDGAFV